MTTGLRLFLALYARQTSRRGRTLLSVLGVALGIALGYGVHLVNRAAVEDLAAGVRAIAGDADLEVRGGRSGFAEEVFATVAKLPNADLVASSYALEWMPEPWRDVDAAGEWLLQLAARTRPDVVYERTPSQVRIYEPWGMASEQGRWAGSWTDADGKIQIGGIYFAKWRLRNGTWLIESETYVPETCTGGVYCRTPP